MSVAITKEGARWLGFYVFCTCELDLDIYERDLKILKMYRVRTYEK